jgi:methylamine dehydrogenase heavy chain
LTYPAGNRTFLMLCGNGTVQRITLDANGHLESRAHTEPFFDPETDPLTEKAARYGDTWLFVSFNGQVHPVRVRNDRAKPRPGFSLFSDAERSAGWRVGGLHFTAVHEASGRLFVIVHQGGADGHKDPGEHVWVYDIRKRRKIAEIELQAPAGAIAVSADDNPLLYAAEGATPALFVYDANSGEHLRMIEGPPFNPGLLQPVLP